MADEGLHDGFALNNIFHKTKSYVSFPPLVFVENNREASTIWNANQ